MIDRLPKKKGELVRMVIAGRVNRVAFYCRMNHRDHDYTQFLDDVKKTVGKSLWKTGMGTGTLF